MSTATETLSWENIAHAYADRGDLDTIVRAIWDDYGAEIFTLCGDDWVLSLIRSRIGRYYHNRRSAAVSTSWAENGNPVGVCRVALKADYWATMWLVNGTPKEMRQLSVVDAKTLANEYGELAARNNAYHTFFEEAAALALKHKVKTLGGLEKKGIDLPGAETIENGEDE